MFFALSNIFANHVNQGIIASNATTIDHCYGALQKIPAWFDSLKCIDKKTCYAGEPVVATFKLYSRLQSKSDIIKNPGFYGFSVHDMINLDDKMVNTEEFNGKEFDVHTIRQVQLYPLQAGIYTIDAMEVKNKVEFSRSVVNKKAEQEIIEGVVDYLKIYRRPILLAGG